MKTYSYKVHSILSHCISAIGLDCGVNVDMDVE